jgi:hypothetical protein
MAQEAVGVSGELIALRFFRTLLHPKSLTG